MDAPLVRVVGIYLPALDRPRHEAFVKEQIDRQNPINFTEELKGFLRRVGREAEIVALSSEELQERREYFEQEFAGVAQVEVLVENPDERFKVSDFQQVDPSISSSLWQVAWNERFLTYDGARVLGEYGFNELPTVSQYRVVFFIHAWRHQLGLNSTYGPLSPVPLSPIPERLWQLAPFELVD